AAGHVGVPQAPVDRARRDRSGQDPRRPEAPRRGRGRAADRRRGTVRGLEARGPNRMAAPNAPDLPEPLVAMRGRSVVLGVTGGIAAYKAVEVCRRLVDAGAHVVPVLTDDAQRFVGALTFSALASEPARTSLFEGGSSGPDPIPHTSLGR